MILWAPVILFRCLLFRKSNLLIDGVLVVLALISLINTGHELKMVASLQYFPLYFAMGILAFLFSVLVTTQEPMQYLRETFRSFLQKKNCPQIQLQLAWGALTTSVLEELVWRVVFQTVLTISIGTPAAVILIAVSFTTLHWSRTGGISLQFMELLIFSLFLGTLYAITQDVLGVIAAHAVRNYLIGIREIVNES